MKRIAENHQDNYFDTEKSQEYLNELKNASLARFENLITTLDQLDIKGKYLEVGCGPGILTQIIARHHPDVTITAIDISKEMIQLAAEDLTENLKDRIDYRLIDICDERVACQLGKYNLIFSTFTMHHLEDMRTAIKNMYSLLNENGLLFIQDLKRVPWLYHIPLKNGFFNSIRASYRPKEIKYILNETGIYNYDIQPVFPYFMQQIKIWKNKNGYNLK